MLPFPRSVPREEVIGEGEYELRCVVQLTEKPKSTINTPSGHTHPLLPAYMEKDESKEREKNPRRYYEMKTFIRFHLVNLLQGATAVAMSGSMHAPLHIRALATLSSSIILLGNHCQQKLSQRSDVFDVNMSSSSAV